MTAFGRSVRFTQRATVIIIARMSDDKQKPVDDLKQGLGLLFRAVKGAVERIPTEQIESAVKDGAKEFGRAIDSFSTELDKAFHKASGTSSQPPAPPPPAAAPPNEPNAANEKRREAKDEPSKQNEHNEPPKGPRIG